jgi:3-dehydroquinate synthase
MSTTIHVPLDERSYEIYIGCNNPEEAVDKIVALLGSGRATLVTDRHVSDLYLESFEKELRKQGIEPSILTILPGESSKSLDTASQLLSEMISHGLGRKRPVIGLGGGVVGDLAGFLAAVYRRGVPVVQIPTSLLAQIDSSVGGKTGVNHGGAKNQVGCFYQPSLVFAPLNALKTLPPRELLGGIGEMLKYGFIRDPSLLDLMEQEKDKLFVPIPESFETLVARCCQMKSDIVAEDERESGIRAILNFGHTFGHALEAATNYKELIHGEAVAIGMVAAARVSHLSGACDAKTADEVERRIAAFGLPIEASKYKDLPWKDTLLLDKKQHGNSIDFIMLHEIGRVEIVSVPLKDVIFWLTRAMFG